MRLRYIYVFVIVLSLASVSITWGYTDICSEGGKALTETTTTFGDYFDRYIKGHRTSGSGLIDDVFNTQKGNSYVLQIRCGNNDVFIMCESKSAGVKELKKGDHVSYAGSIESWAIKFYPGLNERYVLITLGEASIDY